MNFLSTFMILAIQFMLVIALRPSHYTFKKAFSPMKAGSLCKTIPYHIVRLSSVNIPL